MTEPTVLIVDDEPDVLEAMEETLRRLPARCVLARDGNEGLSLLAGVDVVVADYRMPGMDGLKFLREVRLRDPDVRRILVTAYADVDVAIQAVNQAAVDHFIRKPFRPQDLSEAVASSLMRRRVVRLRADERVQGEAGGRQGRRGGGDPPDSDVNIDM